MPQLIPGTRGLRAIFATLLVWLVVGEACALLDHTRLLRPVFGPSAQTAVVLVAAVLIGWRAVVRRDERWTWIAVAAGVAAWGLGNAYWTVILRDAQHIPVPSPADGGFLLFPVLAIPALMRLARTCRGSGCGPSLDASAAALSVASVCTAIVLPRLGNAGGGHTTEIVVALTYPATDLLLVATIVAASARSGWEVGARWAVLAAGIFLIGVADSMYAVDNLHGRYVAGGWYDMGWSGGMLLLSVAAWQSPTPQTGEHAMRHVVLSALFAFIALAVVAAAMIGLAPMAAAVLALLALLAELGRSTITLRDNLRIMQTSRAEALTDPLTGLGNRRRLVLDLDSRMARSHRPAMLLVLFDLDGFKNYNDAFGHPTGDALLVRLATRLRAHLGDAGTAYRMGGDEFCILVERRGASPESVVRAAARRLTERGDGFAVGCTGGHVVMPDEADDVSTALKLADRRMYAAKRSGRLPTSRQSADVLMQALRAHSPLLGDSAASVTVFATAAAERLGIVGEDLDLLRTAAELADIGKIAIPAELLAKSGPLLPSEWRFFAQHPMVGERILAAAPALGLAARVVRSTHERWDGEGYPDGLCGEAIPPAARIIGVASAFDAMTRDRAHRGRLSVAAALDELRDNAGRQFDPEVVAAFAAAITEPVTPARTPALSSGSPR